MQTDSLLNNVKMLSPSELKGFAVKFTLAGICASGGPNQTFVCLDHRRCGSKELVAGSGLILRTIGKTL